MIAALVQLFFSWRVAVLTKNWILCAIVVMGALTGGGNTSCYLFPLFFSLSDQSVASLPRGRSLEYPTSQSSRLSKLAMDTILRSLSLTDFCAGRCHRLASFGEPS